MIALLFAQQLIKTSFEGGTAQELARFYLVQANRSVVCSDGVFKAYGPCRFSVGTESGLMSPRSELFEISHNNIIVRESAVAPAGTTPRLLSNVDSIKTTVYPLFLVGIGSHSIATDNPVRPVNPAPLSITHPIPTARTFMAKGSGRIEDLANSGFSKPITYPLFFGQFGIACSAVQCSEKDLLAAIAQVVDCKLEEKDGVYNFDPNIERVRQRYLNTLNLFGDQSNSVAGIHQRFNYRAFELASADIIRGTLTERKFSPPDFKISDPDLRRLGKELVDTVLKNYLVDPNPKVRELVDQVDDSVPMGLSYSYGFGCNATLHLKNGSTLLI